MTLTLIQELWRVIIKKNTNCPFICTNYHDSYCKPLHYKGDAIWPLVFLISLSIESNHLSCVKKPTKQQCFSLLAIDNEMVTLMINIWLLLLLTFLSKCFLYWFLSCHFVRADDKDAIKLGEAKIRATWGACNYKKVFNIDPQVSLIQFLIKFNWKVYQSIKPYLIINVK